MYSVAASDAGGQRGAGQQSQVSTTTLLNGIHNIYLSSQPYQLDAGTSLVINTWLTAQHTSQNGQPGGTVDQALAARAWEHARRRAEDGCIILGFVRYISSVKDKLANFFQLSPHVHAFSPVSFSLIASSVYTHYRPRCSGVNPPVCRVCYSQQPCYGSACSSRGAAHAQPDRELDGRHRLAFSRGYRHIPRTSQHPFGTWSPCFRRLLLSTHFRIYPCGT